MNIAQFGNSEKKKKNTEKLNNRQYWELETKLTWNDSEKEYATFQFLSKWVK